MLIKLLKYEFRSVGRQLIPLYIGILALATVNHFLWFSGSSSGMMDTVPAIATMMAYVAVCVALGVITILLIIQRFYKGLMTEEGYLMFTLPCRSWQLIAAKGLTASVMMILAGFFGMLSAMLMAMSVRDWSAFFNGFFGLPWIRFFETHALWPLYIVEALVLLLVMLFGVVGHMYVSIAVGHLFKKHRVAFAIVAYIAINIVWSVIVSTIFNLHLDFPLNLNLDVSGPWAVHIGMLLLILIQLVPAAIYFFGTNWILSNKLNLE